MKFSLKDQAISEYKQIINDFITEIKSENKKLFEGIDKSINKTKLEPLYKELDSFIQVYNQVMAVDIVKTAVGKWIESDRSLVKDMRYYSVGEEAEGYCSTIQNEITDVFSNAFEIETLTKPDLNNAEISDEDYIELKNILDQYSNKINNSISTTFKKINTKAADNDIFYSLEQLIGIVESYLVSFDKVLKITVNNIHQISIDGANKTKKSSEELYTEAIKKAEDAVDLVKSLKDSNLTKNNRGNSSSDSGANQDSYDSVASNNPEGTNEDKKTNLDKDKTNNKEDKSEEPEDKSEEPEDKKTNKEKSDDTGNKDSNENKDPSSEDNEKSNGTNEKSLKEKLNDTAKKGAKNILNNIVDNIDKKLNGENNEATNKDNTKTPVKKGINIDFSIDANNSFNKNHSYSTEGHSPYSYGNSDSYTQDNKNGGKNLKETTPKNSKVQKQRREIKLPTIPPEAWEVAGKALDLMIETQSNISPVGAAVKTALPIAKDVASMLGNLDIAPLKPILTSSRGNNGMKSLDYIKNNLDGKAKSKEIGSNTENIIDEKSASNNRPIETDRNSRDEKIPGTNKQYDKSDKPNVNYSDRYNENDYRDNDKYAPDIIKDKYEHNENNRNTGSNGTIPNSNKQYESNIHNGVETNHPNRITYSQSESNGTTPINTEQIDNSNDTDAYKHEPIRNSNNVARVMDENTNTPVIESRYKPEYSIQQPNNNITSGTDNHNQIDTKHTEIRESIIERTVTHDKISSGESYNDITYNKDEEFIVGDYNSNFIDNAIIKSTRHYTSLESMLIKSIKHIGILMSLITNRLTNCTKADIESLIKLFGLVDNIYLTLSESLGDIINNTINLNLRNIESNNDSKYIILNNLLKNDITRNQITNRFGYDIIQFIDDLSKYNPADISVMKSVVELLYKNKFKGKLDTYEMKLLSDIETKWKYFPDSKSFIDKMRLICYAECFLEYNNKAKEFESEQIMCDAWRDLIDIYLNLIGITDVDKKYLNKFYIITDTQYKWKPRLNNINLDDYFKM